LTIVDREKRAFGQLIWAIDYPHGATLHSREWQKKAIGERVGEIGRSGRRGDNSSRYKPPPGKYSL